MERLNLSQNLPGLSALSYDPVKHGQMRADTYNRTEGTLTGYHCTKCLNRGFIAHIREDGSLVMQPCSCKKTRQCLQEMERSGLKQCIRELTFEAYKATKPWQEALKSGVQRYALEGTGWLLLGGQSGSGKTHLCTAVCRERLLKGYEVRYMPWRDRITQLKSTSLDPERRFAMLEDYKNAQILYIDDLYKTGRSADGTDNPSPADINLAFEILNHRYVNRLTTIISTEKTPQELVDIDEATGSRIIEMAGDYVYAIGQDPTKNYRMRSVNNL